MAPTKLIEGQYGTCRVCGSPLIGSTLTAHGQTSHYCPECHNLTPKPIGIWSPVNPKGGSYVEYMAEREETSRRLRRR